MFKDEKIINLQIKMKVRLKMKLKKIAITLIAICNILIFSPKNVQAFQPASHDVLITRVANELPKNSIIAKALKTYPEIAAWGSIGPDLGYLQVSELGGYAPWGDRYHYYKVGSYAAMQLKDALESGDLKNIAFAAGWVSHVSGDLACHGIYVNPECGVYLDNENGRSMHKKMENEAEAYAWVNIGGNSLNDYNTTNFANRFAAVGNIPFDFMNAESLKIYESSPSTVEEKSWANTLLAGLKTGQGYNYVDYNESISFLSQNDREEHLKQAFETSEKQCYELLSSAENGDYSKFTDRWNLDVGKSDSPISSLTAVVTTGTKFGSGTDDDVYFVMELKNGEEKQWKLDKSFYNDFENGDKDEYYLYINDPDFKPDSVSKIWIKKNDASYSVAGDWYFASLKVNVNGQDVLNVSPNKWVKDNSNQEFDVDWSNVNNTTDPVFS